MSSFSIDGLVSGFDTSSIIESLLGFQQNQIDTLNARKQEVLTEQSAFKGIEAQIITLEASLAKLSRSNNAVFNARTATSSNEDVLEVAAGAGALQGRYQLTVEQVATAHQVASQGIASTTAAIAEGTISIGVGSGVQTEIQVDSSNNNLTSLAETINSDVENVSASVIFDQVNSTYRLLLTSQDTGTENSLTINTNFQTGTGEELDFSGPAVQDATDARVSIGSGAGAITAEFASNTIDEFIEGLTINLKKASPGETVVIDVAIDTEGAKESIQGFVDNFNALMTFIEDQTRFIPETEQASPLLGNRNVSTIKNRLLSLVTGSVNTGRNLQRLQQIGVDINLNGKLEVDSGKLDKALNGQLEGIEATDVPLLFGLSGESNNAGVRFLAAGPRTKATSTPIGVEISQVAKQAQIEATNALADTIVIDGSNNELQLSVNGVNSETLSLTAGTYTRSELAEHLQSVVNSSGDLGVNDIIVSLGIDNKLSITSEKFGISSQVSSVSGSSSTTLGFSGTEASNGQNVQGHFVVNGQIEEATGSGRLLIGSLENELTADLQVEVTLDENNLQAGGVEAEVTVFRGITDSLNEAIDEFLDVDSGLIKTVDKEFEARVSLIDESIKKVEATTEAKREDLIREFTALESILSELQNTGDFINSQLQSIQASSSNSRNNN